MTEFLREWHPVFFAAYMVLSGLAISLLGLSYLRLKSSAVGVNAKINATTQNLQDMRYKYESQLVQKMAQISEENTILREQYETLQSDYIALKKAFNDLSDKMLALQEENARLKRLRGGM
jgi:cell division protein FtsB